MHRDQSIELKKNDERMICEKFELIVILPLILYSYYSDDLGNTPIL